MGGIHIEYKNNSIRFGVASLTNRKSKCLYKMRGAIMEPLAYFTSDQNAEEFDKIIDTLFTLLEKGGRKCQHNE